MLGTGILLILVLGFTQLQMMIKFNSGTPVFERDSIVIPIDLKGHKIYVKAKINDSQKDYNFIFDTGALTAIDERLAKELNLEKGEELPTGQEGDKADPYPIFRTPRKDSIFSQEVSRCQRNNSVDDSTHNLNSMLFD
jgi:hypothetical protein